MKKPRTVALLLAGAAALGVVRAARRRRTIDFRERVVLIFGGSRGLGLVMARELAAEGIVVTTVSPGLRRTGSTYNAWFTGQHRREFAWFHLSASLPGLSIDARRAARKILGACRRGQAQLVITPPAKAAVLLRALMPEMTARALDLANRLLPSPSAGRETTARLGWDSTSWLAPSALTTFADRATAENNERRPA